MEGRKEMFYLTTHSFYLRLYCVGSTNNAQLMEMNGVYYNNHL